MTQRPYGQKAAETMTTEEQVIARLTAGYDSLQSAYSIHRSNSCDTSVLLRNLRTSITYLRKAISAAHEEAEYEAEAAHRKAITLAEVTK